MHVNERRNTTHQVAKSHHTRGSSFEKTLIRERTSRSQVDTADTLSRWRHLLSGRKNERVLQRSHFSTCVRGEIDQDERHLRDGSGDPRGDVLDAREVQLDALTDLLEFRRK